MLYYIGSYSLMLTAGYCLGPTTGDTAGADDSAAIDYFPLPLSKDKKLALVSLFFFNLKYLFFVS